MASGTTGYGVTPLGFVPKPLAVIAAEIDAGLKKILGDSAGTEADGSIPVTSMAGQLKTLLADTWADQWDKQQAIYASNDPNQAADASLDALSALTGTLRGSQRQSVATGVCVGSPLTVLEVGRQIETSDTAAPFISATGPITMASLTAWVGTTAYAAGALVTNASRAYLCITAGTSAGAGGPTTTATDITDGSVHWRYIGEGTGYAVILFVAQSFGPVGALANKLTVIDTPVTNWNAVTNPADAIVGRFTENNAALRARRENEVATSGNTTVDAIRANVLQVNQGSTDPNHQQPTSVHVFWNDTDYVNSDGLPPHSIEVLVQDGTDADIAQAIWDSVGAGTYTYGSSSAYATDSEGNSQLVRYTRPTGVPIWVTATGRYQASAWPAGSDGIVAQAMLSALLTYTTGYPIGRDVRQSPLSAAMLRGPYAVGFSGTSGYAIVPAPDGSPAIPGLLEVDTIFIGTATGPTSSAQLTLAGRQLAQFDSSRCSITASTEDP
jgi:hypothetical protein